MKEHKNSAADSNSDLNVRVVSSPKQRKWFDQQLDLSHDLGSSPSIGDFLRQIVELHGKPVALLAWGPACYALKDRDLWISWSAPQRIQRLKLIVQNRRLLILPPKGSSPNLASMAMGAALRALPSQWIDSFGYRPVLAESFTDPEAHHGTTYKATNWIELGTSAGYSRSRLDFYIPNERPKRLWCLELVPKARSILRSRDLPVEYAPALSSVPTGVLPLSQAQFDSLRKAFAQVPDPRKGRNKRFRIGLLLSLIAMALLSGRREIAEIARFAQSLTQEQRKKVGLPLKKGTQAFRIVPGYLVFYRLLCKIDPKALNEVLNTWLASNASTLPQALAMDGKMVRDHFGVLSLARHSDGAPVAMALYDQKEGTEQCEQSAANALIASMPSLDNQLITADALHCQRKVARTIVEKGGEYLLQIKGNQPNLEKRAKTKDSTPGTLFVLTETGHGRVEIRGLATFATDGMEMDFPYARSVVVVRSQRHIKKSGETSQETRYYVSSLDPGERSLENWHRLIRGHWAGVEIRNHWRRDVLFGEDRSRSRNANLLANLALIRTGLLRLSSIKFPGQSIPEIKEHLQSNPCRAIAALAA